MFTTHGLPCSIKTDNGRQFVSEEFKTYLSENGIEHRTSTPYWPQANGEVERQNRTLLKTLKIAHSEKLNIQQELNKFLMAYRSTPHCTTGETPAKLLFGREIRTKLPELQPSITNIESVRDRDKAQKLEGKICADKKRNAKESDVYEGDIVILKQDRENKLSETFGKDTYKVIEKKGNEVTVQGEAGEVYRRNTTFVKPAISNDNPDNSESSEPGVSVAPSPPRNESRELPDRPVRAKRLPGKFKDFVLT